MAYQKLQVSRALQIIKSDDAFIPYPNVVTQGINTLESLTGLIDETGKFITSNVQTGDVVYNVASQRAATVVKVLSETEIILNKGIFLTTGDSYVIYAQNDKNEGCVLYVGTGGNLFVLTHGGDEVVFANVLGGTFLPVQVLKVFDDGTSASNIVALW